MLCAWALSEKTLCAGATKRVEGVVRPGAQREDFLRQRGQVVEIIRLGAQREDFVCQRGQAVEGFVHQQGRGH
jgi:hypothetical protein